MKYFFPEATLVTLRAMPGYYPSLLTARYAAKHLCWVIEEDWKASLKYETIVSYLCGTTPDWRYFTPNESAIIMAFLEWLSFRDEQSDVKSVFCANNLNCGRSIVFQVKSYKSTEEVS